MRAGALPGQSLVALDPQRKLICHVHCCEDGHTQERALVDDAVAWVEPGQVWVADRNFATGHPPAALFAFCLAVVAYNVLRLTRAALGAAHGPETIERAVSTYYAGGGVD